MSIDCQGPSSLADAIIELTTTWCPAPASATEPGGYKEKSFNLVAGECYRVRDTPGNQFYPDAAAGQGKYHCKYRLNVSTVHHSITGP